MPFMVDLVMHRQGTSSGMQGTKRTSEPCAFAGFFAIDSASGMRTRGVGGSDGNAPICPSQRCPEHHVFSKAKQSRQRQVARSPASSARANARSSVRASGRAKNRKLESSGSSAPRASVQGGPLARVKNAVASERATKTKAINWQLWRQVMLRLGQAGLALALASPKGTTSSRKISESSSANMEGSPFRGRVPEVSVTVAGRSLSVMKTPFP